MFSYFSREKRQTKHDHTRVEPILDLKTPGDCQFLKHLPTELRLQIYYHVFSADRTPRAFIVTTSNQDYQSQDELSHHTSLAILQTCRQIYAEAKLVAWQNRDFLASRTLPLYVFRKRASLLPPLQLSAITRLTSKVSHDDYTHPHYSRDISNFLAHGAIVLPNVHSIRLLYPRKGFIDQNPDFGRRIASTCLQHVPVWFTETMNRFVRGFRDSYLWDTGQTWTLDWPYYHIHPSDRGFQEPLEEEEWCDGDCSAVCTEVESGRRITVTLVYMWYSRHASPPVYLDREVEMRLPVEETCSDTGLMGIGYDPGEKYWRERYKVKPHGPERNAFGFKPGGPADAANLLWRSSLVKSAWDGLMRKDVTVLRVPEHIQNGTVGPRFMEGFGTDGMGYGRAPVEDPCGIDEKV